MQDIVDRFARDGFAVVEGIVNPASAAAVLANISGLYRKFTGDREAFAGMAEPWLSQAFHDRLLALRQRDPQTFGALYDSAQTSIALTQLVSDRHVVELTAAFLGCTPVDLSTSGQMCRMDAPHDTRNAFGWHQERSYYPENRDGLHGLVCWIPLTDVVLKMGPPQLCPGSHAEGFLAPSSAGKPDYITSEQFELPPEAVARYETAGSAIKLGDALFFNMLLFHRSGENLSGRFRFAVQGRYHIATAEDFVPFRPIASYNQFIRQQLVDKNHDCADIPT